MKAKFEGNIITSMEELLNLCTISIINSYKGRTKDSSAILTSLANPKVIIMVDFDNIMECKLFESKIRNQCTQFSPKKFDDVPDSTIAVSNMLKNQLNKLKEPKESYEMIIWRLILEHYNLI